MRIYPSYKSCRTPWIGSVPSHWTQCTLKHVINEFVAGGTPSTNEPSFWADGSNGTPWVAIGDMSNRDVISETAKHLTTSGLSDKRLSPLPAGSVLYSMYASVGFAAILNMPAATNQAILGLSHGQEVDPRYLRAFLNAARPHVLREASSNTQDNLNAEKVKNLPFVLPPIGEQIAIASYLDDETARIDGLIEAKTELLELLRGFDATAFFSALCAMAEGQQGRCDEQVRWLPNLPFAWGRCKVKHLVLSFDQGVSPQCESRIPDEGEWGVLKVGCVNTGGFNPMESKALPPEIPPVPEVVVDEGDLLISRANTKDLVGRSAVATRSFPKLMLSDKLYRLKLDGTRCYPEFVRRLLWIPAVRQMIEERATGASPSMLNIDRRTILEITVPLPSIDEQAKILRESEAANSGAQSLIRHVEREIELLRELRSATITDAVLGRIDVREHMKS